MTCICKLSYIYLCVNISQKPCDPIQPPKAKPATLRPLSSAKWAKIRKAGQPESATSPNGTCNNSNLTVAKRRKFPYIYKKKIFKKKTWNLTPVPGRLLVL